MTTAAQKPTEPKTTELSVRILAWAVRFLFWLTLLASVIVALFSLLLLSYARIIANDHALRKDFLVNLAAGCAQVAIGILVAAVVARAIAKSKLRELSRPVLALIQRLRIDSKLSPEGARRSVVCAVALLSESNVSKQIRPGSDGPNTDCPICAQGVTERTNHCFYCQLPRTIWRDEEFVEIHQNSPTKSN